jgi:hypothetical protein
MNCRQHLRLLTWMVALALFSIQGARAHEEPRAEAVAVVDLLVPEMPKVPWWRCEGACTREIDGETFFLRTAGEGRAVQPLAAYAPTVERLVLSGEVRGSGELTVVDGKGRRALWELGGSPSEWEAFEIDGSQLRAKLGVEPMPRLFLRLAALNGGQADWRNLSARVVLPCPSEKALREEILAELRFIFGVWLERGLDREGPRSTGFACHIFDVVSGKRLSTGTGGLFPLFGFLSEAHALEPDPAWAEAFQRYAGDYLELCLNPEDGQPKRWKPLEDVPEVRWIEVAADLSFLLDLCGTESRERALAAALRMGETILERGLLPDGSVASKYQAGNSGFSTDVPPLRQLDVPAQLARLAKESGEERFLEAARSAFSELEFHLHWPGTWDAIDPGFDDTFGHLGERALVMLEAFPSERMFSSLLQEAFAHYGPLWRDALRLGGSIAADQVRCWEIGLRAARLSPGLGHEFSPLFHDAMRAHFKGEQYGNGAWGDVSFFGFDPKPNLQVGDLPGVPSNLLWGLGLCYKSGGDLRNESVRAMYAAVLRSTVAAYRRPYGYLLTQRERRGQNRCTGELRILPGLIAMLAALSEGGSGSWPR